MKAVAPQNIVSTKGVHSEAQRQWHHEIGANLSYLTIVTGGSRISHRGVWTLEAVTFCYVKTEEYGPLGWGMQLAFVYVDPPLNFSCLS